MEPTRLTRWVLAVAGPPAPQQRGRSGVEWHYARGHAGIPGNERVDEIADGLAQGREIIVRYLLRGRRRRP